VALLRDAGFQVEAKDDHFHHATADVDWLPLVIRRGWVILTKDKNIAFDEREIEALMTCGGRAYLPKGQMSPGKFAELIIFSRARILRDIRHHEKYKTGAYMSKICPGKDDGKPGSVEAWMDRGKWQEKRAKRVDKRRR
jgi:hypothetical protein